MASLQYLFLVLGSTWSILKLLYSSQKIVCLKSMCVWALPLVVLLHHLRCTIIKSPQKSNLGNLYDPFKLDVWQLASSLHEFKVRSTLPLAYSRLHHRVLEQNPGYRRHSDSNGRWWSSLSALCTTGLRSSWSNCRLDASGVVVIRAWRCLQVQFWYQLGLYHW